MLVGCVGSISTPPGVDPTDAGSSGPCETTRQFFASKAWPMINAKCTGCHAPGGSAATGQNPLNRTAGFVLQWDAYPDFLAINLTQLQRMVVEQIGDQPKLLLAPMGGDSHVGGAVITAGTPEAAVLHELVDRLKAPTETCTTAAKDPLAGVTSLDWSATLRRATLDLAGRLPTEAERVVPDEATFDQRLNAVMHEEAFIDRMKDVWNDVLLTNGGDRVQVGSFQFDSDEYPPAKVGQDGADKTCASATNPDACRTAFYEFWDQVQRAQVSEPLELIANVLRKNAPFTEVLTADYGMANPYTASIYGLGAQFDPPSLSTATQWKEVHVVAKTRGPVAHAGLLTTSGFLGRWVSTDTNKNRARARVIYRVFLATDVLKLAQRPVDATELTAVANPPRNAAACNVCHNIVDPVANSFSSFSDGSGYDYDPTVTAATTRHQEMLPPGFAGQLVPGPSNTMLPWLAKAVVKDDRFAISVARTAFRGLTRQSPLPFPATTGTAVDPDALAAWEAEDAFLHQLAQAFVADGFEFRTLVRLIVKSPWYRASDASPTTSPALSARLGLGKMLTPEQLDRKIEAITGTHWGGWSNLTTRTRELRSRYTIFMGGIDSFAVTTRLDDTNPVVANVAERMANEVSCRVVGWDFTRPSASRSLFPKVELATLPPTGEAQLRENLVHLIDRFWGEHVSVSDPEVDALLTLFTQSQALLTTKNASPDYGCLGLWDRASAQLYPCGTQGQPDYNPSCYFYDTMLPASRQISSDPDHTLGAWMAVITTMLADPRFLFD